MLKYTVILTSRTCVLRDFQHFIIMNIYVYNCVPTIAIPGPFSPNLI